MKSILNVKKTSNLIEVISTYNICSGIKSQQAKKTISHSVPKTFDFSQNFSVPFHQVTFIKSQKKLLKRKEKNITPAKTNVPTSSERLTVTIQTYRMGNKEVKMKLGQLHEEISKASLPVTADLSNDFKSIILKTDQRKIS